MTACFFPSLQGIIVKGMQEQISDVEKEKERVRRDWDKEKSYIL